MAIKIKILNIVVYRVIRIRCSTNRGASHMLIIYTICDKSQKYVWSTHHNFPNDGDIRDLLAQENFVNHQANYQCEQPK